jgi:hypothetical protein
MDDNSEDEGSTQSNKSSNTFDIATACFERKEGSTKLYITLSDFGQMSMVEFDEAVIITKINPREEYTMKPKSDNIPDIIRLMIKDLYNNDMETIEVSKLILDDTTVCLAYLYGGDVDMHVLSPLLMNTARVQVGKMGLTWNSWSNFMVSKKIFETGLWNLMPVTQRRESNIKYIMNMISKPFNLDYCRMLTQLCDIDLNKTEPLGKAKQMAVIKESANNKIILDLDTIVNLSKLMPLINEARKLSVKIQCYGSDQNKLEPLIDFDYEKVQTIKIDNAIIVSNDLNIISHYIDKIPENGYLISDWYWCYNIARVPDLFKRLLRSADESVELFKDLQNKWHNKCETLISEASNYVDSIIRNFNSCKVCLFKDVQITDSIDVSDSCFKTCCEKLGLNFDSSYLGQQYTINEILNILMERQIAINIIITDDVTKPIHLGLKLTRQGVLSDKCMLILTGETTNHCMTAKAMIADCQDQSELINYLDQPIIDYSQIDESGIMSELGSRKYKTKTEMLSKGIGKRIEDDMSKCIMGVFKPNQWNNNTILEVPNSITKDAVLVWLEKLNGNCELHVCKVQTLPLNKVIVVEGSNFNGVIRVLRFEVEKSTKKETVSLSVSQLSYSTKDRDLLSSYGIETLIMNNQSKGELMLINYDNRSHHNRKSVMEKFKDGEITITFKTIFSSTLRGISLLDFESTYNESTNRKTLINGEIKYLTECTHVSLAIALAKLLDINRDQNCVYDSSRVDYKQYLDGTVEVTSSSGAKMRQLTTDATWEMVTMSRLAEELQSMITGKKWALVQPEDPILMEVYTNLVSISFINSGAILVEIRNRLYLVNETLHTFVDCGDIIRGKTKINEYPLSSKSKPGDWWGIKPTSNVSQIAGDTDINFMSYINKPDYRTWIKWSPDTPSTNQGRWTYIDEQEQQIDVVNCIPLTNSRHELILDNYDFWTMSDLTVHTVKYGPLTTGRLKSKEQFSGFVEMIKHTLVEYPAKSRPVDTLTMYKTHNTITGRLMSVRKIRVNRPLTSTILAKLNQAYFHNDAMEMITNFRKDPITYNTKWTLDWISKHHNSIKVAKDLNDFITAGTSDRLISDINVHLKLESLLKTKVIRTFLEQQPRSILWQNYFVAAIFSPIFMEAKRRLKMLFHDKMIHADGCTPEQLQLMLSTKNRSKYIFENDLVKQDRQTDDPIIEVELSMYHALGVHDDVLALWQSVHEVWRFKSKYEWGFCSSMRMTGQATTSLGNGLTNLQVHCDFILDNKEELDYYMFTGDDNNSGFANRPDLSNLNNEIALNFNMESEATIRDTHGAFCCFLVKTTDGKPSLVPDLVRLRNRYEVPNGTSEINDTNMKMRAMSYSLFLGPTKRIMEHAKINNWPIELKSWYKLSEAMSACAYHYNISEEEVLNDMSLLEDMIVNEELYEHKWLTIKSKRL